MKRNLVFGDFSFVPFFADAAASVSAFTPPAAHLLAAHFSHYGFLAAAHAAQAAKDPLGFAGPAPLPAHTGSSLTPPPETRAPLKKDLFRPYCLQVKIFMHFMFERAGC